MGIFSYRFTMGVPHEALVNPDGPEAAARIAALEVQNARLREALEALLSWWPKGSEVTSMAGKAKGDGFAKDIQAARAALTGGTDD